MVTQLLDNILRKPKTRKGKAILKSRLPKVKEAQRKIGVFKAPKLKNEYSLFLNELCILNPQAFWCSKDQSNDIPSDDSSFFLKKCTNSDSSAFFYAYGSKKNSNLFIARLYNGSILDSFTLQLKNFKHMSEIKNLNMNINSIPTIVFNGSHFEISDKMKTFKEFFTDILNTQPLEKLDPASLNKIVSFTSCGEDEFYYRTFIYSDVSNRLEIEDCGPNADFKILSYTPPSPDMLKESKMTVKSMKAKKSNRKNRETDDIGNDIGRIRMPNQELHLLSKSTFKNALKK
ncbi:MAG: rRNA-binding ribosome biosynthesis protein rpf2 [Marteilia pararefringens]